MNLKESNKCTCGRETTKHLWKSCPKSELKYLHNTELNLIKIRQNKDKPKEFQLLLKKMEKRIKDEENQFKNQKCGQKIRKIIRFLVG
jgi:hypothetical protein